MAQYPRLFHCLAVSIFCYSVCVLTGPVSCFQLAQQTSSAVHAQKKICPLLATVADENAATSPKKKTWFPTRIQESVDYNSIVQRLYVRHIVTETKAMADWVLQQYTSNTLQNEQDQYDSSAAFDPFATLAEQVSMCSATKSEGGKIGWIERSDEYEILPASVIQQVFAQQPKAGDVVILPSASQWHTIQVMELWTALAFEDKTGSKIEGKEISTASDDEAPVGAFGGSNALLPRRKLKGQGVLPIVDLGDLKTYSIQTSGCQMNVADSERLEGVLQNELGLKHSDESKQADLILFNTCSIRDHAEQKLYDTLGP